jgi:hypothetical protein
MKKFSADYFEKKYRILFKKLYLKAGFLDAVKEVRKKLGLPEEGFGSEVDLATFFISKMSNGEQQMLSFFAFAEDYCIRNKLKMDDESNKDKIFDAYMKASRKEKGLKMIIGLAKEISEHNQMLTKIPLFRKNKYLSKLFPPTIELIRKFWGYDLLDEHIMGHFVEKYLFLGDYGVEQYIKHKIACTSCRYIGIDHFSPDRHDMEDGDKGIGRKEYIFNKSAVRRLSLHFNSVFLIIKPYATKEETLQYVEDNWDNLKEHVIEKNTFYKQMDVHPSKIKESDFERNQLVYELHKLSKKELLKRYGGEKDFSGTGVYKEAVISAMLHEQYETEMSPDAVKKAAARFAKSTNAKRQLKDIGDI